MGIESNKSIDTKERTFLLIKPEGVQNGKISEVIKKFEQKGLKCVGLKMVMATQEQISDHYAEHSVRDFFQFLVNKMLEGPVVAMIWEGLNAVRNCRRLIGETFPTMSHPSSIRGSLQIENGRELGIIHGSDAVKAAEREIKIWFQPEEIMTWTRKSDNWIHENK